MKGIVAASGMALATAHLLTEPEIAVEKYIVGDVFSELERFHRAVSDCHSRIERLMEDMESIAAPQVVEILDFQLLLLEDTDFIGKIEEIVSVDRLNSEFAVKDASEKYISYLDSLTDNDYLRERAADVSDLSLRLIAAISGIMTGISEPDGEYIAIGSDIAPSLITELDRSKLKGIILEKGGITSHSVILSKSLGIPCLIGAAGILEAVKEGEAVLLDAISGEAVINPDDAKINFYNKYISDESVEKANLTLYIKRGSKTLDGSEIKVYANIATKTEADEAVRQGGEGVGLFRSEIIYMSQANRPPSEEKQYQEYSETASILGDRPLIIRTLDIGGDKRIGYMNIGKEDNPFLGYRAIRFCLDHPQIFKPQISAILRAGTAGNVWMMLPMITNKTEIYKAKQIVEQVKNELKEQKKPFNPYIKIGIMVETPAAAIDAEILAKESDFFSIGTNDLAQYLFAADRTNANVAGLNSHFQPALLRIIHSVVNAAHKAGIEVDICGQAAEVDSLIPIWAAMGIDNLSVSIPRITAVRRRICNISKSECGDLLDKVLRLETAYETEQTLNNFIEQRSFYDN